MFERILDKLKAIQREVEALDDPTDDSGAREKVGAAWDYIDECIDKIDEL